MKNLLIALLFAPLAALTVGFALAVVLNKNTVNAAVCLLVSLLGVAGIFALLDALLLSVLLILVYAGAVVALFLFIVMLLKPQDTARSYKKVSLASSVLAGALLATGVWSLITRGQFSSEPAPEGFAGGLKEYGTKLFTTYLLPVEIVGFLLLVAMLGVIVLSKKLESEEAAK